MSQPMKTFAILGASRDGFDPDEMKIMRDVGRVLAEQGKTVCVGCVTGQTEQAIWGALEAGGDCKVFLIPSQQQNSVEQCEKIGIPFIEVSRDNERTLELLRCDGWVSGYMSIGSVGETARGATWNQDRKIRGRSQTPHFYLDRSKTNRLFIDAYKAAAEEGRADSSLIDQLFIPFESPAQLIAKIVEFEKNTALVSDQVRDHKGGNGQVLRP